MSEINRNVTPRDPLEGYTPHLFPKIGRLFFFITDQIHTSDDARSDHPHKVDEMLLGEPDPRQIADGYDEQDYGNG